MNSIINERYDVWKTADYTNPSNYLDPAFHKTVPFCALRDPGGWIVFS
jgi:hypothetical protein